MSTSPEDLKQGNTLTEGQIFEGRFEIISVLGQGGVGVVYKARQTHMNKLVAIKTLNLAVVADDANFKRFEQEAQAASALNHANIISIFDFGKTQAGLAYLVMEYLEGHSLDQILDRERRLGPDRFLRITTQVCDGLQHAHRKGIVHRDMKPSNIMLVRSEEQHDLVKIVDFGLAKLTSADAEKHLTQTGTIVGTPLYMSPEQCRGMELNHRSDIYSLGCILYCALTGREPIRGKMPIASRIGARLEKLGETFDRVGTSQQIASLEKEGNALSSQKDWQDAEPQFQKSLQLKQQLYPGNDDFHLFSTLCRIVQCELNERKSEKMKVHLNWALEIFTAHPDQAHQAIIHMRNSDYYWLPMARACRQIAHKTGDPVYYNWALSFFKLAKTDWQAPRDNDAYRTLLAEFDDTVMESKRSSQTRNAPQNQRDMKSPQAQGRKHGGNKAKPHRGHSFEKGGMRFWQK